MVYNKKFIVVVKCNGKVLREQGDTIFLPYQSEYSILLKNLESRPACVTSIDIDGRNVLGHNSLVIDPNSETELTGFLQGSVVNNKFKFIQKTKQIQDHRGDKVDDGMIRVEYAFEKKVEKKVTVHEHHHYDYTPPLYDNFDVTWHNSNPFRQYKSSGGTSRSMSFFSNSSGAPTPSQNVVVGASAPSNVTMDWMENPQEDEGITVEGSKTHQDFQYTTIGDLESSEVIVIRMRGLTSSGAVKKPLNVKSRLTCNYCGGVSSSRAKFCAGCGASLQI